MIEVAGQLRDEVDSALPRLRRLAEGDVARDRGPGKWIKAEMYRGLRLALAAGSLVSRTEAAQAAMAYLGEVSSRAVW